MGLSSKQVSVDSRPEWSAHSQGLLFEAGEIEPEKPKPLGRQATLQKLQGGGAGQPPPLKCPRCDSSNTKFCYYNNYSRSQPRHFCKACRRHWTNGGTLRNVPVGGTRKAKRPRTSHLPSSSATAASNDNIDMATATTMQQQEPFSFSDVIRQALLHQPPSSMPAVMPDYLSAGIDGSAGGPGILGSLMHLQPMPSFTNTMGSSAGFVDSAGDAFVPSYSSFLRLTMHEEPIAGEEEKAMPATDSSMISAATAPWMQSSLLTCSLAAGTSPLETAPQNTDAAGHAGGGGYWWDDLTGFVSPPPPPPPPPPQNSHLLL